MPTPYSPEPDFVIESILSSRVHEGRLQYLLRFEGAHQNEDVWEDAHNLQCAELISAYIARTRRTPLIDRMDITPDRRTTPDAASVVSYIVSPHPRGGVRFLEGGSRSLLSLASEDPVTRRTYGDTESLQAILRDHQLAANLPRVQIEADAPLYHYRVEILCFDFHPRIGLHEIALFGHVGVFRLTRCVFDLLAQGAYVIQHADDIFILQFAPTRA